MDWSSFALGLGTGFIGAVVLGWAALLRIWDDDFEEEDRRNANPWN